MALLMTTFNENNQAFKICNEFKDELEDKTGD